MRGVTALYLPPPPIKTTQSLPPGLSKASIQVQLYLRGLVPYNEPHHNDSSVADHHCYSSNKTLSTLIMAFSFFLSFFFFEVTKIASGVLMHAFPLMVQNIC